MGLRDQQLSVILNLVQDLIHKKQEIPKQIRNNAAVSKEIPAGQVRPIKNGLAMADTNKDCLKPT